MKTVGVVGLGAMGKPILARLSSCGFPVVGYDRSGGGSLADMAVADFVFVVVPTDDDVSTVVTELAPSMRHGSVIAVSSSVRPATCVRLASYTVQYGVELLDVALTGGI